MSRIELLRSGQDPKNDTPQERPVEPRKMAQAVAIPRVGGRSIDTRGRCEVLRRQGYWVLKRDSYSPPMTATDLCFAPARELTCTRR